MAKRKPCVEVNEFAEPDDDPAGSIAITAWYDYRCQSKKETAQKQSKREARNEKERCAALMAIATEAMRLMIESQSS